MKILLADDDFLSRKILFKSMERYGECDLACNGKEAWEAFRNALEQGSPYGLVLLDIMMPEMDGGEVLCRIRDFEKSRGIMGLDCVQVVMASALRDSGHVLGAFEDQCDGYIRKPYTRESIQEDLRKHGIKTEASA